MLKQRRPTNKQYRAWKKLCNVSNGFQEVQNSFRSFTRQQFSNFSGVLNISMGRTTSEYMVSTPTLVGNADCIHSLLWDASAQVFTEYPSFNDIKIWITLWIYRSKLHHTIQHMIRIKKSRHLFHRMRALWNLMQTFKCVAKLNRDNRARWIFQDNASSVCQNYSSCTL